MEKVTAVMTDFYATNTRRMRSMSLTMPSRLRAWLRKVEPRGERAVLKHRLSSTWRRLQIFHPGSSHHT